MNSLVSNETNCTETDHLSEDEVIEHYNLLKKQFDSLLSSYEVIKQKLNDTKRNYQTALNEQNHLSVKLQSVLANEATLKSELDSRILSLQEEISQLREDRAETAKRHAAEINSLENQIGMLKKDKVNKSRKSSLKECPNQELQAARKLTSTLRVEAMSVQETLEEAMTELLQLRQETVELMGELNKWRLLADLRRELLQASRKREIDILADMEVATTLFQQSTGPHDVQPCAAEGSSVFAVVEDKNQEMVKYLISMKQTNSRLCRELIDKQAEVETLLDEKQTIWEEEIGAVSQYDKKIIESYAERINQLEDLHERQRCEQARSLAKIAELTASGCLPDIMEHLKSECEKLQNELSEKSAAQLACAFQVRELRGKLATLRVNFAKVAKSPVDSTN